MEKASIIFEERMVWPMRVVNGPYHPLSLVVAIVLIGTVDKDSLARGIGGPPLRWG